ncbi:MAG TPA: FHA domain-containing protein, partial [Polyangiaceae bacterium]|nr:FHA domain-containing protein [Polyangiaceae bacterium]
MAKAVLTFALYQADQLTRRETVTQDIVKVGKDPKSHLRVDDELASRMHAVIEVAGPEDITLIDLGNEPGTMVNGARVNKCKLHVGDQIQVGDTKIILESAEAAGAEAAPPAATAFAAAPNPFASASTSSPFAAASNPFA